MNTIDKTLINFYQKAIEKNEESIAKYKDKLKTLEETNKYLKQEMERKQSDKQ